MRPDVVVQEMRQVQRRGNVVREGIRQQDGQGVDAARESCPDSFGGARCRNRSIGRHAHSVEVARCGMHEVLNVAVEALQQGVCDRASHVQIAPIGHRRQQEPDRDEVCAIAQQMRVLLGNFEPQRRATLDVAGHACAPEHRCAFRRTRGDPAHSLNSVLTVGWAPIMSCTPANRPRRRRSSQRTTEECVCMPGTADG